MVVTLFATLLAAAASPAAAQDIEVFRFRNADTGSNLDGVAESWEVRVTARSFGGCVPSKGEGSHVSVWLKVNEVSGANLNTGECRYVITAVARSNKRSGRVCDTGLAWGTNVGTNTELHTASSTRGLETQVSVQHLGGDTPLCSTAPTVRFRIDPDEVVEALPATAADSALEARARRAVEITEFQVRVRPDKSTVNLAGCDQSLNFSMFGDDEEEVETLQPISAGVTCKFVTTIANLDPPFQATKTRSEPFSSGNDDIEVDLSELVELPHARIAIIQNVSNSNNQGQAKYTIARDCAGVAALPPAVSGGGGSGIYTLPGGGTVAALRNGRFTVHSPTSVNFGATAVYPAVATSTVSSVISGCSVTVTIEGLPDNCAVAGSEVKTLEWTAANPVENFDFEFVIDCSGTPATTTTTTTAATTTTTTAATTTTTTAPDLPPPPADDPDDGAESASGEVRIVARKRDNGKIEFGLQQQQDDDSWGDRLLPSQRFFPTTARVDRWLVSTPLTISVAASADAFAEDIEVRIVARKLETGRIEFGLQERDDDDSWGERLLPTRRFFPPTSRVDRWLNSSVLTVDGE